MTCLINDSLDGSASFCSLLLDLGDASEPGSPTLYDMQSPGLYISSWRGEVKRLL